MPFLHHVPVSGKLKEVTFVIPFFNYILGPYNRVVKIMASVVNENTAFVFIDIIEKSCFLTYLKAHCTLALFFLILLSIYSHHIEKIRLYILFGSSFSAFI